MKKKVAFITGITGQDGSLLAKFLLKKDYAVHGLKRRASSFNTGRIDSIYEEHQLKNKSLILHYGDLTDSLSMYDLLNRIKPDEIYNLGAQSHVAISFINPEYTTNVDGIGNLRILDVITKLNFKKNIRFFQASTSEMYGNQKKTLDELSKFEPVSPYASAKLLAYWNTKIYRKAYGLFASNGIMFNHESSVRGENFISKKVTKAVVEIFLGKRETLYVGNLNSKRDWGYAGDYVEGMWKILQYKKPDDFVMATNETYAVREFIELAFREVGIKISWKGKGIKEVGFDRKTNKILVKVDSIYFRPNEVEYLKGNYNKIKKTIGWKPKVKFKQLVKMMVKDDLKHLNKTL